MPWPEQEALDRLTSRTDLAGTFTYDPVRKHAVTSAGGVSYGYDANGNMSTRNGATIAWTSYNLPASLSASGYTASFNYAPDRSRWRQIATYTGATETTIYVAGLVEKLTTSARVHWKHRIAVPAGEVQVIRRSDGTNDVFYITTDHLGSTDTVTDASATVLARESFGAWGARRAANWQGSPSPGEWQQIANTTRRGYTGHEQLDNVLLVHMNGRVYDPAIGRFMSADPYVDGADTTQGWNRFAYVRNRPMAYTDPTGFYTAGEGLNWKVVWINGRDLEEVTVTGRSPTVDEMLAGARFLGDIRNALTQPSAGLPFDEEGLESITVTATRLPSMTPRRDRPQGESWLCELKDVTAGAASGAVGAATIAVMTGQPEFIVPALVGGAIAGGAVGAVAPDGGIGAFVAGVYASAILHVPTGPSGSAFAEIAADGASASVPNGALTVPVGAGLGAVGGLLKPAFALSRVSGAVVGGSAGGMAAINSFLTIVLVETAFERFLGCTP